MAERTVSIFQQQTKPIKVLKWKVKIGTVVSIGYPLLTYDFVGALKAEQRKLKCTQAGTVSMILAKEGQVVQPGETLLELQPCTHPTIMNDMCAECGADLRKNDDVSIASVPMIHAIPDLKVSEEVAQKLGKADSERLLKDRKLVLLVDLDQTLIHTTNDNIPANIKDVYHFQLHGPVSPWYHTRLRPGTHRFLSNIHDYYELHICTFGARHYAHTIAMFLDPDHKYFSNRILSRDECFDPTSKKANLKALFPCGDNMVCIIDDREDVWSHATNLIHVKPYHFFQHTGDINAPPGLDKHENDKLAGGIDLTNIADKVRNNTKPRNKKNFVTSEQEKATAIKNNQNETANNKVEKLEENKVRNVNDTDADIKSKEEVDKKSNDANEKVEHKPDSHIEGKSTNEVVEEKKEVDEKKEEQSNQNKEQHKNEETPKDNTETTNGLPDKLGHQMEETSKKKSEEVNVTRNQSVENKLNSTEENIQIPQENFIEIDDPDDYLIYLEEILKQIHNDFYNKYDKMESGEVPDLKRVIPKVRSNVLKGCKLVFSGLVPTHVKLEHSKAYQVAKGLGAKVSQNFEDDTTHLVAVRPGTAKVNSGRRKKKLKIVTPDWLWCCAERWEHVDERIFPLNSKGSKNRHPPPHCSSPEHIVNYPEHGIPEMRKRTPSGKFMDTINPLMSFSSDDIADMDKEVEDILDDDSDSSDDETSKINMTEDGQILSEFSKNDPSESSNSSSEESLTAEYPRGHKRKKSDEIDFPENDDLFNISDGEDESPSVKFRRGEMVDDGLDFDQEDTRDSIDPPDEVDDGEWNMMGAALEREFLSNN